MCRILDYRGDHLFPDIEKALKFCGGTPFVDIEKPVSSPTQDTAASGLVAAHWDGSEYHFGKGAAGARLGEETFETVGVSCGPLAGEYSGGMLISITYNKS